MKRTWFIPPLLILELPKVLLTKNIHPSARQNFIIWLSKKNFNSFTSRTVTDKTCEKRTNEQTNMRTQEEILIQESQVALNLRNTVKLNFIQRIFDKLKTPIFRLTSHTGWYVFHFDIA